MKIISKKLCALMLTLTILLSSASIIKLSTKETKAAENTQATSCCLGRTGDLEIGQKTNEDIPVIHSPQEYYNVVSKASNSGNKKDIAMTGLSPDLPSFVDNSTSKYFPKIGNQGGIGACVVFATVYYQFTYTMNKHRSVATTDDNIFSVKWNYNFVNSGKDTGSTAFSNYELLKQHGCPYEKSFPFDGVDYKGWCLDEKAWREAMRYKLKDYQKIEDFGKEGKEITSNKDSDLKTLKTALNNGDIIKFSSYIYDWDYDKIKTNPDVPENNKYEGEQFVRVVKGHEGGHGMVIVGYNDDLWCDINKNDKVDDGEMGALKIANSWGESYGNKGFMWIAYDALNKVSVVDGTEHYDNKPVGIDDLYRIDVCDPNEGKEIYAKFTLNTESRADMLIKFTADKNGSEYQKYFLSTIGYNTIENHVAFDGSNKACDITFLYPLSDLSPEISAENFEAYNFNVTISDRNANSKPLTVKYFSIVNEFTGIEYKANANFPISVENNETTINLKECTQNNAVIYYIGFDNPILHFKKSTDSQFTKVQMEENDEHRGSLYKYVIENVTDDITLYFSADNGKIDNNNGAYYKAKVGLNNYYTKNQREKINLNDFELSNGIPDIGKRCVLDIDTTGGYEPYQYKYVIEHLDTGKVKVCDYDYNFIMSPYSFFNEGTYRITVTAMDYAKETSSLTKEFEVINHPFEISSVTPDREVGIVSKNIRFESITAFEGIASYGGYRAESQFVVKDSSGKVWADQVVKYSTYSTVIKTTTTHFDFIPKKAGEYTLTVSSDDCNLEYAEKTINFTVYDMIYGDADGNGTINVLDATKIQLFIADLDKGKDIFKDLADGDVSGGITIIDASIIQRHLASLPKTGQVGKIIEYIPPTEPETQPPTEKPTDTPTTPVVKNTVTFTNSFSWSGQLYCYYWSESNTAMTSWPGKAMTSAGKNDFGESIYTFEVPNDVTKIIFTNGSAQTTDIDYKGGEVKYYPISQTDSSGHYLVKTW